MTLKQTDTRSPDIMPALPDEHVVIATLSCPQPDTTVCTVTGRVDLVTAPALTDTLTEAIHDDRLHLVIDLSAADLLDSGGLHAVFQALDRYDIDGHVAVVVDVEAITPPDITALGEFLDMHDNLADALRACATASVFTAGRHRAKVMD